MTNPTNDPLDTHIRLDLRDGRSVRVRHLRATDAKLLETMFYQLSPETRWRRFFVPLDHVDPDFVRKGAKRLARIDPNREAALVALSDEPDGEAAVAVSRYAALNTDATSVEASVVLRDDWQHVGLGLQMVDLLVQVALAHEVKHMVMLTHADNLGMIHIVQHLGLPYHGHFSSGLYEIDVQLAAEEHPLFHFSGRKAE